MQKKPKYSKTIANVAMGGRVTAGAIIAASDPSSVIP